MSIIYMLALLATSTGLYILIIIIWHMLARLFRDYLPSLPAALYFYLAIGVFLFVFGIDLLVHLDQF